ncbi:Cytochrome c oxidase polypeptide [Paragonimus heterotremus]|uniref:Cytochrome c oxidase subunit 5A, mitochondrial n=1 Tax=Paragonimus heterotremus TaxID=100268 RepID=A0A8J4TR63_9TREM|nr:Cytochrome c oxidase polypeptide [Paragonimus heterotremus]
MLRLLRVASRAVLVNSSRCTNFPVALVPIAQHSTNPKYFNAVEPYEEFRSRFLDAFNDKTLDGWWLRTWMQKLNLEDAIPPPEVVSSALRACRRLNDVALAIRFLEAVRLKCKVVSGSWEWLQKEIQPTMTELGIPSISQLGYDKPELAWPDYDD